MVDNNIDLDLRISLDLTLIEKSHHIVQTLKVCAQMIDKKIKAAGKSIVDLGLAPMTNMDQANPLDFPMREPRKVTKRKTRALSNVSPVALRLAALTVRRGATFCFFLFLQPLRTAARLHTAF